MLYSDKHRFICMCRAKTGSTSIIQLLEEQFDAKIYRDWHPVLRKRNKLDPDFRHVCALPEDLAGRGYFIFALVRNPYALEMSHYNYWPTSKEWEKRRPLNAWPKDISFSEYLRCYAKDWWPCLSDMYLRSKAPPGCVPYVPDQLIHLESLEEDFRSLPFVKEKVVMPKRNAQTYRADSLYTSVEDVNFVYELRRPDFENFGYSKRLPWKLWTAKNL